MPSPGALVLSAALLVAVIRRFTRSPDWAAQPPALPAANPPPAEYVRRLDDDLDAMD